MKTEQASRSLPCSAGPVAERLGSGCGSTKATCTTRVELCTINTWRRARYAVETVLWQAVVLFAHHSSNFVAQLVSGETALGFIGLVGAIEPGCLQACACEIRCWAGASAVRASDALISLGAGVLVRGARLALFDHNMQIVVPRLVICANSGSCDGC